MWPLSKCPLRNLASEAEGVPLACVPCGLRQSRLALGTLSHGDGVS